MFNLRRILIVVFAACAGAALAQAPAPRVQLELPNSIRAGQTVKATIVVTFSSGFYGYQNPPTKDYQIPVKVESAVRGLTLSKITYPKGVRMTVAGEASDVYTGTIRIPIEFRAQSTAGRQAIRVKVSFQQCNDDACFPPGSVEASGTLQVRR
jgi:DsbC/DsbD-like thiol-disulfide interchange protein